MEAIFFSFLFSDFLISLICFEFFDFFDFVDFFILFGFVDLFFFVKGFSIVLNFISFFLFLFLVLVLVRDQVYNTCCCEFLVWSAFLSLVWHMHDVCL